MHVAFGVRCSVYLILHARALRIYALLIYEFYISYNIYFNYNSFFQLHFFFFYFIPYFLDCNSFFYYATFAKLSFEYYILSFPLHLLLLWGGVSVRRLLLSSTSPSHLSGAVSVPYIYRTHCFRHIFNAS